MISLFLSVNERANVKGSVTCFALLLSIIDRLTLTDSGGSQWDVRAPTLKSSIFGTVDMKGFITKLVEVSWAAGSSSTENRLDFIIISMFLTFSQEIIEKIAKL